MMRWMTLCLMVAISVAGAGTVRAHDDFRIIGTLMKHENSTIEVKNKAGKTIAIRLDRQTAISRDNKKVPASELRVGQSLVVDAYGDTEDDSLAIAIRIVPPIRAGGA